MGAVPYLVAQSRSKALGQRCAHAVGGMNITGMTAKSSEWSGIAAITGLPVRVGAFEWYNEKTLPYGTVSDHMVTYCSTVRAMASTTLGLGSSTSYSTDATDYTGANGRKGYNDYLGANHASMCDAYWPIHGDVNIGNYSAFATYPSNWSGDGVHLTPTSRSTYLKPLMLAGMNALGA